MRKQVLLGSVIRGMKAGMKEQVGTLYCSLVMREHPTQDRTPTENYTDKRRVLEKGSSRN